MPIQPKPAFHAPLLIRWTEEKLQLLDQEQLVNLLANLDHQRAIGRIAAEAAEVLERNIVARLDRRNGAARRKQRATDGASGGGAAVTEVAAVASV